MVLVEEDVSLVEGEVVVDDGDWLCSEGGDNGGGRGDTPG